VGYALDLCLKVADAVKRQLNLPKLEVAYLPVSSANRMQAIVDGKADLECGSTTNNAERRQQVAFTIPLHHRRAHPGARQHQVRQDQRLRAQEAGHHQGHHRAQGGAARQRGAPALHRHRRGPQPCRAVEMLDKGQVDGFAMDDVLLYGLRSERPDPEKYKVVGGFLTIEPLAIMLSKDDPEFKAVVDAEMKRLITSREAYAIYDRWFTKPIPPRNVSLNMPMNYLLRDFWKYPSDMVPN
jgi:glutamate/aspartate transport system substrate-binding protein